MVAVSGHDGRFRNGFYMDESLDHDMWLLSGEQEERSDPSYWRTRLATRLKCDSALVDQIGLSVVLFLLSRLDDLDEQIRANESWRSFLRRNGGGFDSEYYGIKADLEYQYGQVAEIGHHLESFAKGHVGGWQSQYDLWLALLCHLRSGALRRKLSSMWSSRRLCRT